MLRILHNIRLVLVIVIGVPVLIFAGISAAWTYVKGDGALELVAPEEGLSFSIDGAPPVTLAGYGHQKVKLAQGEHKVDLDGTVRTVKVSSGWAHLLVPAADQCFVVLDVSKSHYDFGKTRGTPPLPRIKDRVGVDQVTDLPSSIYFSEDSLPSTIKENSSCNLLEQVPCDELALPDGELLANMGFEH